MTTILVTDDYAVTQRVMGHILRRYGYEVLVADHGLQALERLAAHPVDLMLLDISMPEMDGLTLLRHLRTSDEYADLPIVMLTASGQDSDRFAAEELGADGFLSKPAGSAELVEMVRLVLGE